MPNSKGSTSNQNNQRDYDEDYQYVMNQSSDNSGEKQQIGFSGKQILQRRAYGGSLSTVREEQETLLDRTQFYQLNSSAKKQLDYSKQKTNGTNLNFVQEFEQQDSNIPENPRDDSEENTEYQQQQFKQILQSSIKKQSGKKDVEMEFDKPDNLLNKRKSRKSLTDKKQNTRKSNSAYQSKSNDMEQYGIQSDQVFMNDQSMQYLKSQGNDKNVSNITKPKNNTKARKKPQQVTLNEMIGLDDNQSQASLKVKKPRAPRKPKETKPKIEEEKKQIQSQPQKKQVKPLTQNQTKAQQFYVQSHQRLKSLLDNNEDCSDKTILLNDRIVEIDRQIAELVYEKRKCMDFQHSIQESVIQRDISHQQSDQIEQNISSTSSKYKESNLNQIDKWEYQKNSALIKSKLEVFEKIVENKSQLNIDTNQEQKIQTAPVIQNYYDLSPVQDVSQNLISSNSAKDFGSVQFEQKEQIPARVTYTPQINYQDQEDYSQLGLEGVMEMPMLSQFMTEHKQDDVNLHSQEEVSVQSLQELKDQIFSDDSSSLFPVM
eukprot:403374068